MNNNSKIRIYQLGKELELSSKEVLTAAKKLNILAKTHASSITNTDAKRITDFLALEGEKNQSKSEAKKASKIDITDSSIIQKKTKLTVKNKRNKNHKQASLKNNLVSIKQDIQENITSKKLSVFDNVSNFSLKDIKVFIKNNISSIQNNQNSLKTGATESY